MIAQHPLCVDRPLEVFPQQILARMARGPYVAESHLLAPEFLGRIARRVAWQQSETHDAPPLCCDDLRFHTTTASLPYSSDTGDDYAAGPEERIPRPPTPSRQPG